MEYCNRQEIEIAPSNSEILDANLSFWKHLCDDEQADILAESRTLFYRRGTIMHDATGIKSPGIRILKKGRVRVFISSPENRQLTLFRTRTDDLFSIGVGCILTKVKYDILLEAETPCEIVLIPREKCLELYGNPMFKNTLIDVLAARFAYVMRILEAVTFTSTRSRLANALVERSVIAESCLFRATHASIAADIGTSRVVVTRLLNTFEREGLLEITREGIRIIDREAFSAMRGSYLEYINGQLYPKIV